MAVLGFILRNLDHFRRRFYAVLAASLLNGVAALAVPLLLTEFTGSGFTFARFERLIALLLVMLAAFLSAERVIRKHGESLAAQFGNHLRLKYFGLLEEQPMSRLSAQHSGYTVALVGNLAGKVQAILMDVFWSFSGMAVSLAFFLYFAVREAWWLALFNIAILAIFLVTSTILARRMAALATGLNKRSATFLQYFVDLLGNLPTIKRLGIREFASARLGEKAGEANDQVQRVQDFHANRWAALHAIFYTANFTTIGVLLYKISAGQLSPSVLIIFIAIFSNIRGSIERLSENILAFAEAKVYVHDLESLVRRDAGNGLRVVPRDWNRIAMRGISFSYPGSTHRITVPELTVSGGETICISGKSGQGKTTVLSLLAGFLQPDQGECSMDAIAYGDIDPHWFRDHVACISQDVELFSLSVWDNLTLGRPASETAVRALLRQLDMGTWPDSLEDGWDTLVGERGLRLSAGQRQRVNLARGILLDKDIYLLDEPTASLDGETEEHVITALEQALTGKTVIIVTHRDAIRRICSREYEMRDHALLPQAATEAGT